MKDYKGIYLSIGKHTKAEKFNQYYSQEVNLKFKNVFSHQSPQTE